MKCFAFISYSRIDFKVAHWLHKKLEKYPYPQNLVAVENCPPHGKFIRRVFMDVKDLSVTEKEFVPEIKQNLKDARYLIVICSKHSAISEFVEREILYFLETHENRYELILPVFVDQVEGCIPSVLSEIDILKRNCPIYNSRLDERSEANLYCFYHVASFLLKVDFTKLYDRYESYSKRKRRNERRVIAAFIALLLCSTTFLFISLNRQRVLTEKQKELTEFEKNVFPLSVVFGYEKNFLNPAITYLKENCSSFGIYVLMPYHVGDLKHQDRIERAGSCIKEELHADSVYSERLPTQMKRGTLIGRIATRDSRYARVYVDFASTTSTFLQILNYKKEKFPELDEDEVIRDYSDTFIRQTKELLGADSVYVHFFVSQDEFIRTLKSVEDKPL